MIEQSYSTPIDYQSKEIQFYVVKTSSGYDNDVIKDIQKKRKMRKIFETCFKKISEIIIILINI